MYLLPSNVCTVRASMGDFVGGILISSHGCDYHKERSKFFVVLSDRLSGVMETTVLVYEQSRNR